MGKGEGSETGNRRGRRGADETTDVSYLEYLVAVDGYGHNGGMGVGGTVGYIAHNKTTATHQALFVQQTLVFVRAVVSMPYYSISQKKGRPDHAHTFMIVDTMHIVQLT
jgi:hypothetical protein